VKILITGSCGYKGHVLVPKLLSRGYEVIAFDLQWFGCFLAPHKNLKIVKGDVRDVD
jgi:nucleoside-diphosphate-sugar epimerase